MFDVKLNYKKAMRQAKRQQKQVEKRMLSVSRRELKRGGKRFAREGARTMRKNTGIKLIQKEVMSRYIKQKFIDSKVLDTLWFVVKFRREGIALIRFLVGKPKQTKGPLKKRKSPYVSVYKGKKIRARRSFILKLKKPGKGPPYQIFIRNSKKYRLGVTPSIITLLTNSGFKIDKQADKEHRIIVANILKAQKWVMEPLTKDS